jgi:hypothetical protein
MRKIVFHSPISVMDFEDQLVIIRNVRGEKGVARFNSGEMGVKSGHLPHRMGPFQGASECGGNNGANLPGRTNNKSGEPGVASGNKRESVPTARSEDK